MNTRLEDAQLGYSISVFNKTVVAGSPKTKSSGKNAFACSFLLLESHILTTELLRHCQRPSMPEERTSSISTMKQ